jgi:NitT/TauT family transport system substrate-binding protein
MRAVSFIVAGAVALFALGADAEPLKLRVQWPSSPGYMTPMIPFVPKGVFKHYGESYTVEPVFIQGSSQALTAFAANELELPGFTPQALTFAVLEAKLDVKAIGQWVSTDVPGMTRGGGFWVNKTEIKKVEDLKGKVVAVNGRGTAVGATAVLFLKKHGLVEGQDYQLVELRFEAGWPALESKRVATAFLNRPFDQMAAKNPDYQYLFGMGDVFGRQETGFMVAKTEFVAKNRAALVDFLEDQIRMRKWAYDPKTHDEAVKVLAQAMKQPEASLAYAYTKDDNAYRDPGMKIDVGALQHNVDVLKEAGMINAAVAVKGYVDMSLAEEAGKRINASR